MGLLAAVPLLFQINCFAALGPPWEWKVDDIPSQTFESKQQAEAAMRSLGGKYELATVVEDQRISPTARHTFMARIHVAPC